MTAEEIGKIIAQGEGISIEFKKAMEKVPASLYETVVSFANTRGGYILLGVDDDGTVLGINPANRLSQTEKPTKLSNKKMRYLLVILFASAIPVTIDELMELFEYRHKDTFRQNYVKPLESIGFITKTQPEKPTASNQKYVITEQGKRFLTGQSN